MKIKKPIHTAPKKREQKEDKNKDKVISYDTNSDNELDINEFLTKHMGLIIHLASQHASNLPTHLRVTMHNDLISEATLIAYQYDKKWDKDLSKGKSRRNWMIFCINTGLIEYRTKFMPKQGNTFQSGAMRTELLPGEYKESEIDIDTALHLYYDTLSGKDRLLFSQYCEGVPVRYIATEVKGRNEVIIKRIKELKEEFIEHVRVARNS